MAAVLAPNSCYCRDVQLINRQRTAGNLGFSRSVSIHKLDRHECSSPKVRIFHRFYVEMKQTKSPEKFGTNGRPVNLATNGHPMILGSKGQPITMIPINEAVNRKHLPKQRSGTLNGSAQTVKGTSLVKREITPPLIKSVKAIEPIGFPPSEELQGLQTDESFSWANENYNLAQRSIDVWSFVLSLYVCVMLDNAKWAYLGSYTEEKQFPEMNQKWGFLVWLFFSFCGLICVAGNFVKRWLTRRRADMRRTTQWTRVSEYMTVEIKVKMDCDGCERRVKNSVKHMNGVKTVEVNRKQSQVTLSGYVDPNHVLKRIKSTGKRAEFWPYIPYNLVSYPYVNQAYDKRAPAGYVKNVVQAISDKDMDVVREDWARFVANFIYYTS